MNIKAFSELLIDLNETVGEKIPDKNGFTHVKLKSDWKY